MQRVQRLPLLIKYAKRCSSCNHTLVKPEVKRLDALKDRERDRERQLYKIKLLASSYLPQVELGNRRRIRGTDVSSTAIKRASMMSLIEARDVETSEHKQHSSLLQRPRDDTGKDALDSRRASMLPLRGIEEEEKLGTPLRPGVSVSSTG
jgi:hypothetical protein